jgi:hypothetical protein
MEFQSTAKTGPASTSAVLNATISILLIKLFNTVMALLWMNRLIGIGIFLWPRRKAVEGFELVRIKRARKTGHVEGGK